MKLYMPEYYKNFHCIANNCKNNCCKTGWEIDIDNKTANFYKQVEGNFGKKLKMYTDLNNDPKRFKLNQNGHCPFLNNKNLCEIYINLGSDSLCQICAEHPRYYEWFNNLKEGGIGLCCEESARIILSQCTPFKSYCVEVPYELPNDYNENIYVYLRKVRSKILLYIDNQIFPLNIHLKNVLWYSYIIQQNIDSNLLDNENIIDIKINQKNDLKPVLDFLLTLDPNDKNWIIYLQNCISRFDVYMAYKSEFEKNNSHIDKYLKNISIYFIWRYFLKGVFDEEILSKVKLMIVSFLTLKYLFFFAWFEKGSLTLDDCVFITRRFSEEIEYSEDNLFSLADASYTLKIFSTDYLMGLLN